MWCSDEPNVLKAYNNERTYVTGVQFIVSLGTVDLSARKRGFAGTSLDSRRAQRHDKSGASFIVSKHHNFRNIGRICMELRYKYHLITHHCYSDLLAYLIIKHCGCQVKLYRDVHDNH